MTDIRQEVVKTADELANLAKEAAYVAIGVGVLGFHRAQVRRREFAQAADRAGRARDLQGSMAEARKELAERVKHLDATVGEVLKSIDSTLEPMWQRLPESAQAVVHQARESRDQVRARVRKFAA